MPRGHKDALLAAARTLLRRKGLRGTTARDLVEESGTNLASIGYHYGGKDELMDTALTEIWREWTDRPVAAALGAQDEGPGASLVAALRTMLAGLRERRADILVFAEAVVASGRGDAEGARLPAATTDSLAAVAASMRASAPGLTPEMAAAGAAVVIALHDGLALLSTVTPDAVPEPDMVIAVLAGFGSVLLPTLGLTPDQLFDLMTGEQPAP